MTKKSFEPHGGASPTPQEPITDLVSACIVAVFYIQKLGKATSVEVGERIAQNGGAINEHLLAEALEAARHRGFLSYARGRSSTGNVHKAYVMKRVVWAAPPEIAHLSSLLPTLLETDAGKELIDAFNEDEVTDSGTRKAKRGLDITNFTTVVINLVTLDELLGSQPSSPVLDRLVKKTRPPAPDADLRFWRDDDGNPMLASDMLAAWIRTHLRVWRINPSLANYISVAPVVFRGIHLEQVSLPVIARAGKGAGTPTYEVIPTGVEFDLYVTFPEKGFMSPDAFVAGLAAIGPNPLRGISPARGKRFGKVAVTGYTVMESVLDRKVWETCGATALPPKAAAFMVEMQQKFAGKRLRDL